MSHGLLAESLAILWVGLLPAKLIAGVTVQPAPPGQRTVVNNGPGDQTDPHVSGNLCSYSNAINGAFTVRYHDLSSGTDQAIPNDGTTLDFLADISGNTIALTRVSATQSAIFTYTIAAPPAFEIAPMAGSSRQSAQIGAPIVYVKIADCVAETRVKAMVL